MTLLTDTDILRLKDKEIVIDPFEERNLTPIGYDFTVGDLVVSLSRGILAPDSETKCYSINPSEIVLIQTRELLLVSGRVAGTLHSKVSLVSQGFSQIATTVDPEWKGKLLVAMINHTQRQLILELGQQFVTIVFFRTASRATKKSSKIQSRIDILLGLLAEGNPQASQEEADKLRANMVKKLKGILSESDIAVLDERMRAMTASIGIKVAAATRRLLYVRGKYFLFLVLHFVAIGVVTFLAFNLATWNPALSQDVLVPAAITADAALIVSALKFSYE